MRVDRSTLAALGFALTAAVIFTLVFASAKIIGSAADPIQIVFMRYCGASVVIVAIVLARHGSLTPLKSPRPGVHVMRATSGVLGELCIITAPLFIAYEDATAISLIDGVIAMILAAVLLKERAGPLNWLAAMTCLAGAMVIARADAGFGALDAPLFGLGFALFGALMSGTETFYIKLLSDREAPLGIMLYVNILAFFMTLVPALLVWKPVDGGALVWLVLLGPVALIGQFAWIRAFQCADALFVVPVGYASIPFAAILGAVAFRQQLGGLEMIGAALVIAGGAVLAFVSTSKTDKAEA